MDILTGDLVRWGVLVLLAVLVVVSSVLAIAKPRVAWDLQQLARVWQYQQAPEPSRAALRWTRASGVITLILLGLAALLYLIAALL